MSQTTFSPSAATQALLTQKTIPALDEIQYQQLTDYLFSADEPLRFAVAEMVFRHDRQHPQALGLFLACAYPVAQKVARRLYQKTLPNLTEELLYDGAVNAAIAMFKNDHIPDDMVIRRALHHRMKLGAIDAAFDDRLEYTRVTASNRGTVDHFGSRSRLVEQLIARQMLEKIAAFEPEYRPASTFLRYLLKLGPSALLPLSLRKKQWLIDFEPFMKELQISRTSAAVYLCRARKLLREKFNQDGTLFIRTLPR